MKRNWRRASLGIAAVLGSALLAGCGGQPAVKAYFGYADTGVTHKPEPGSFPRPWEGDPHVNFVGRGPQYDAGAVRLENPGDRDVTVQDVSVDAGGQHYAIWGHNLRVPAHGSLVLTQTETGSQGQESNFDTSEPSPNPDHSAPVLRVKVNGRSSNITDSQRILTTGGTDLGNKPGNPNESHRWTQAGTVEVEGAGVSLGWAPVTALLLGLLSFIPVLVGALLLLLLGWLLARFLARLVAVLLARMGLDAVAERMGIVPAALHGPRHMSGTARHPHRGSPAWLLGWGVGIFVLLVVLEAVAAALHLGQLAALLGAFALFVPNLLVALLLLGGGLMLARVLAGVVGAFAADAGLPAGVLSWAVRAAVIFLAATAAAMQLGIAAPILQALFTAVCVALAVALGLAFGLGGQETARQLISRWFGRRELG